MPVTLLQSAERVPEEPETTTRPRSATNCEAPLPGSFSFSPGDGLGREAFLVEADSSYMFRVWVGLLHHVSACRADTRMCVVQTSRPASSRGVLAEERASKAVT